MGSFILAKNGAPIYHKTIGYSQIDGDKKTPATANTQYRIGSITKIFTSVMIFQLIEEKKLTLDTKLFNYFPEMPNADRITIANLLNHSSGLSDHVNENREWVTDPHTKAELLDKIAKVKPHFEPGAKQQYSNGGYLLLGYIIEKITGQTYEVALKKRITHKIGTKSIIAGTINNSQKLEARPYSFTGSWTPNKDLYFPNIRGVGDILSTPQDLIVFLHALMSGKLVNMDSYNKMKNFNGSEMNGMGLMQGHFYARQLIGHNGGTLGSYSSVYANPADGMSFAITTNGMNFNMNDIALAMIKAYYNLPYQIPVHLKTEELDELLGNYTSLDHPLKLSITKSGSVLMAQATGQPIFSLDAVSRNEFKHEQYDVLLKFDRQKYEITLVQGGKDFHYVLEK